MRSVFTGIKDLFRRAETYPEDGYETCPKCGYIGKTIKTIHRAKKIMVIECPGCKAKHEKELPTLN